MSSSLQQIEFIASSTGAGKVNLIGHSEGGLDARYVMAVRPDLVASLTTVATPHLGAELADFLADNIDAGGFNGAVLSALGNSLGTIIDLLTGTTSPQDALGAVRSLSAAGAADFNQRFPAGLAATRCGATPTSASGIPLYSWAGSSKLTNLLDVSDPALGIASLFYSEANDGLVGRCSSHFGKVLRDDYRMNHLDEVNQLFGLVSIFESSPGLGVPLARQPAQERRTLIQRRRWGVRVMLRRVVLRRPWCHASCAQAVL